MRGYLTMVAIGFAVFAGGVAENASAEVWVGPTVAYVGLEGASEAGFEVGVLARFPRFGARWNVDASLDYSRTSRSRTPTPAGTLRRGPACGSRSDAEVRRRGGKARRPPPGRGLLRGPPPCTNVASPTPSERVAPARSARRPVARPVLRRRRDTRRTASDPDGPASRRAEVKT